MESRPHHYQHHYGNGTVLLGTERSRHWRKMRERAGWKARTHVRLQCRSLCTRVPVSHRLGSVAQSGDSSLYAPPLLSYWSTRTWQAAFLPSSHIFYLGKWWSSLLIPLVLVSSLTGLYIYIYMKQKIEMCFTYIWYITVNIQIYKLISKHSPLHTWTQKDGFTQAQFRWKKGCQCTETMFTCKHLSCLINCICRLLQSSCTEGLSDSAKWLTQHRLTLVAQNPFCNTVMT